MQCCALTQLTELKAKLQFRNFNYVAALLSWQIDQTGMKNVSQPWTLLYSVSTVYNRLLSAVQIIVTFKPMTIWWHQSHHIAVYSAMEHVTWDRWTEPCRDRFYKKKNCFHISHLQIYILFLLTCFTVQFWSEQWYRLWPWAPWDISLPMEKSSPTEKLQNIHET